MKQIVPSKERILFTNVYLCYIFINDLSWLIAATWCVSRSYFVRGCSRAIEISSLQTQTAARWF